MKKYLASLVGVFALGVVLMAPNAQAATSYSQTVTLASGWNVISTPRILDSHSFSAAENSTNFDIYVLDAASTAGWSTMSALGQTEFAPLYGYFINNKTGSSQTLTLNYKDGVAPNERLFSRTFSSTGWYSVGVANATYALSQGDPITPDTNNVTNIFSSLQSGDYSTAVDFTAGDYSTNPDSVAVSNTWDARSVSDGVNGLHDLRDTKGYAVYITRASSLYSGFQNGSAPQCLDGIDNDADGFIDYPADGGCSNASDNSEAPGTPGVTIAAATSVPSANVSINVSNQTLGGFTVTVADEAISVPHMAFSVATSSTGAGVLTNLTIVDPNGSVVAGPVDQAANGSVTFTDTVTFPVGTTTYKVKGKLPANFLNNGTVTISTDPATGWTGAVGQTTGNALSFTGAAAVTMNTMTVKAASLSISASTTPASQNIVPGTSSLTLANLSLNATNSGEDVRMSSLKIRFTLGNGAQTSDLSTCRVYNGSTALNTGSNVVNSVSSTTATSFVLDNSLTIPKGTVVSLAVKCDLSGSATSGSTYAVGVNSSDSFSATGVTSGSSVDPSQLIVTTGTSGTMTVAIATLAVSVDSSSPSYSMGVAGNTGVTMGVYKFRATTESIQLTKLGLKLTSGSASDIVQAYVYSGATLVGTAVFTGINTAATSTLSTPVTLVKDADTILTIKADLAAVGTSQPGTEGALIKIDPANAQGNGVSSGITINTGATGGVSGVRLLKTAPTFALDTISSSGLADGRLMRFRITANAAGALGINKFTFAIATSSANVSSIQLFSYTDSAYSSPISGQGTNGQIGATVDGVGSAAFTINPTTDPVQVPAGTTRYFELRASVSGVVTGSSAVTVLQGDSSFDGMGTASGVSGNFVWSPNAVGVSTTGTADWTNAFGAAGLPASGLIQTRAN